MQERLHQIELESLIDINGECFQLLEEVGRGGMGVVYKARQIKLDRLVAVKMLHHSIIQEPVSRERLQKEAQTLARIQHANIVKVHSLHMATQGRLFLAMEYVEGQTLEKFLAEKGKLTADECKYIFAQVLSALEYAHNAGIIHRDLKPSNIIVSADMGTKLMDFGIARALTGDDAGAQRLTRTGSLLGSPSYMSPEQCNGSSVDVRADIYSLGCVMFEALSGRQLFTGDTALEIMYKQLQEMPSLAENDLPPDFAAIVACAVEKNPADRFQNTAEYAQALAGASAITSKSNSLVKCFKTVKPAASSCRLENPASRNNQRALRPAIAIVLIIAVLAVISLIGYRLVSRSVSKSGPGAAPEERGALSLSEAMRQHRQLQADIDCRKFNSREDVERAEQQTANLLQQALDAPGHMSNSPQLLCLAYLELGTLYEGLKDESRAVQAFWNAAKCTQKNFPDDKQAYCDILVHIGHVYQEQNHWRQALDWYGKAAKIEESLVVTAVTSMDRAELGVTYGEIGRLYGDQGNFSQAELYCRKAQSVFAGAELGNDNRSIRNAWELCIVLLFENRAKEAMQLAEKTLSIAENNLKNETDQRNLVSCFAFLHSSYDVVIRCAQQLDDVKKVEEMFQTWCKSMAAPGASAQRYLNDIYCKYSEYKFNRLHDRQAAFILLRKAIDAGEAAGMFPLTKAGQYRAQLEHILALREQAQAEEFARLIKELKDKPDDY